MNEAKEVRLVFNPGKHGTVGLHAVITMSGDRAGALPQPTRRGYTFLGWYTVPDGAAAAKLLCACRAAGVPTLLIGNGSNLLVGDGGVRGVVWRFDPKTAEMATDGETVTCGAGVPLRIFLGVWDSGTRLVGFYRAL